jgi:hypothetical protein
MHRTALIAVFLCLQFCLPAAALEFSSSHPQFTATNPGLNVVDFEGIAPDRSFILNVSPDIAPGVRLVGEAFAAIDQNHISERYQRSTPSDFLVHDRINNEMSIDFTPGIRAVGVRIALSGFYSAQSAWPLEVRLLKDGVVLDARQLTINDVYKFDSFVGYSHVEGATRLEIDGQIETNTVLAIDDLRFALVPEPQSLHIAVLGTCALLLRCRWEKV